MRKVILFLLVFVSAKVNAQVYQEMPQYGYRANRMAFDSTLQIPTVCGVPTLKSVVKTNKSGAIAYDSCNARFYAYNPKTLTWTAITSGSVDTTSLNNRINLKIDSLKRSNDSVYAYRNGTRVFQYKDSVGTTIDTTNQFVKRLTRTPGKDSIIFFVGGNRFVIKDSVGGGTTPTLQQVTTSGAISTNSITVAGLNLGSVGTSISFSPSGSDKFSITNSTNGDNILEVNNSATGSLKWGGGTYPYVEISNSSIGNVNLTAPGTNGTIALTSDTTNQFVKRLTRTPGKDSIIYFVGANRFAIKDSVGGGGVPYTGATQDVDLGAFKISAQSFQVEGTNGLGHIHFKHQNSDATATGQSTVLYANSNGDLKYKNAGNYYSTLKTQQSADRVYTFQNKSYTLADSSDLSAKLNATDTASLSNRINLKLNIADTSTMLSKYLRKIDTATLSNRINLKLNISDTATMLNPYLRKIDTATLSNRINLKLNIADTSTLQPKSISAYTILANNTSATANATAQYFKDTSGTYTGTITWSNSNPSGATTHTYRWVRIGNMVTLYISLVYATVSAANNASVIFALPSDCPTPAKPTGLNSASAYLYPAIGNAGQTLSGLGVAIRGGLRNNAANNGFEINVAFTGITTIYAQTTVTYFTN